MRTRFLALCIYLAPFLFHTPVKLPLYLSLDCPACALELEKIEQTQQFVRLYLVDQPLEVNCLLGKIYQIDPSKQIPFLHFYKTHFPHIPLKDFCEEMQIDKTQLEACKNCALYQINVKEILFYVMRYFISTVPYGGGNQYNSTTNDRKLCTP
ncbi:MAG: hypothetical protein ACOYK9_01030 [Chlamydiia bacterium]